MTPTPARPAPPTRLMLRVALWTFALDQLTKLFVVHWLDLAARRAIDVWPPYLNLRMAWNEGVNFGLFANFDMRWVLVGLAVAISVAVAVWVGREGAGRRAHVAAGLLIGGAMGNVVDRVAYGAVADFLNMSCCGIDNPYAFNVADIAVFLGAGGLVLFAGGGRGAAPTAPGQGARRAPKPPAARAMSQKPGPKAPAKPAPKAE